MNNSPLLKAAHLLMGSNMSIREIARATGLSRGKVLRLKAKLFKKGITASDIESMDEAQLKRMIRTVRERNKQFRKPDFDNVHKQMHLPGMTKMLCWEEYFVIDPETAYSYPQYTHMYRLYLKKLDVTMRQPHQPGELYVDFAGKTIPYTDIKTGEVHKAQLFIAVLGYSNYTFVTAVNSQSLPDWITAHNKALEFYGGVPRQIIPDNLKAAVTKPGREPVLNRTYLEWGNHNGALIMPARPRKPQDKGKVEFGVLYTYRWILARLRNHTFFSLEEINAAISELLIQLNERPFKKLPGCRSSRFEEEEKSALLPLAAEQYEYAVWCHQQTVPRDYHVFVQKHHYSVPYRLLGEKVEARVTAKTVEIFCNGERVATHSVSKEMGGYTTDPKHQPPNHRAYAEHTPDKIRAWAKSVGEATSGFVEELIKRYPNPLLALGPCSSLKKLAKTYNNERLESACKYAKKYNTFSLGNLRWILKRELDLREEERTPIQTTLPLHENVRGPSYYVEAQ